MLATPVPQNEAERLEALHRYEILDTDPEQKFDDRSPRPAEFRRVR